MAKRKPSKAEIERRKQHARWMISSLKRSYRQQKKYLCFQEAELRKQFKILRSADRTCENTKNRLRQFERQIKKYEEKIACLTDIK